MMGEELNASEVSERGLVGDRAYAVLDRSDGKVASAKNPRKWPDMEGLDYQDTVTDFELPEGTFFDAAAVHLLTTATLDRLCELYSHGRFEVRRFRPNIVVATSDGATGFVENAWIDRTVRIG